MRTRNVMVPAIAVFLWSAAVCHGQAPAESTKPSGSVEQRWPANEATEPAAPQPVVPPEQSNQPAERETPPAQAQERKVEPPAAAEEHKVQHMQAQEHKVEPPAQAQEPNRQPAASRAQTAEPRAEANKQDAQPHKRATAKPATATVPTAAGKPTKTHQAAQKPAKPKKIQRARARSAPNTATAQQPGGLPPFGFPLSGRSSTGSGQSGTPIGSNPFGALPFSGSPFGAPTASEPGAIKRRPSAATTLQR